MTIPRRLLPAALLAFSACLVSTDNLKPKTQEECTAQDPNTKACGYKCVSIDDPNTGCSAADCAPCSTSGLPHVAPYCDRTTHSCTEGCAAGWGNCDAVASGCETFLLDDAHNCGACGRVCAGTCWNGMCAAASTSIPFNSTSLPRGMLTYQGQVYFVQDDPAPSNQMLRTVDTSALAPPSELGHVRWLAVNPTNGLLWATSTDPYGTDLALTAVDASTLTPTVYPQFAPYSGEYLDGIAVAGSGKVLFTTSMDPDLVVYDPSATPTTATTWITTGAVSGTPKGIVRVSDSYLLGYSDNGGTLVQVQESSSASGSDLSVVDRYSFAGDGGGTPSRLTAWQDPNTATVYVFWASEDDGGVRWAPFGNWAGWNYLQLPSGSTSLMDITSDPDGVYWTNRDTGTIWMWSYAKNTVAPLSWSSAPFGVTARNGIVYWSDDYDRQIYWAPRL